MPCCRQAQAHGLAFAMRGQHGAAGGRAGAYVRIAAPAQALPVHGGPAACARPWRMRMCTGGAARPRKRAGKALRRSGIRALWGWPKPAPGRCLGGTCPPLAAAGAFVRSRLFGGASAQSQTGCFGPRTPRPRAQGARPGPGPETASELRNGKRASAVSPAPANERASGLPRWLYECSVSRNHTALRGAPSGRVGEARAHRLATCAASPCVRLPRAVAG